MDKLVNIYVFGILECPGRNENRDTKKTFRKEWADKPISSLICRMSFLFHRKLHPVK